MMLNCIWRWNHPLPLPDHYQRNIIAFSNNSGPHRKQRQPVKRSFRNKVYKQDPGNPGLGSLSFLLHISSSIENAVKTTDLNDVVVLSVLTILNRSQLSSTVFLFQYIDLFLKVAGKKIWGPVFPVQDVQCQLERAVEITCFRKMDKLVHIICGRYHILCF